MKIIFITILFIFCFSQLYATTIITNIEYGISFHYSLSGGMWKISFPDYLYDGNYIIGTSQLEYKDINNMSFSLLFNFKLFDFVFIRLNIQPEWFTINIKDGRGLDSDLYTIPGSSPYLFSQSSFKNSNNATHFNVDTKIKLKMMKLKNKLITINCLFGYKKHLENVTMKEGIQLVSDNSAFTNLTIPPVGSMFYSLESTYQFDWNSLAGGISLDGEMLSWLHIEIQGAFLYNFYSGEGYWNLRTYNAYPDEYAWRNESPNFIHYDASGIGWLLGINVNFIQTHASQIVFGYKYIFQSARKGKEELYFYNSEYNVLADNVSLDKVEFKKHIFSLSILNKF